MRLMKPFTVCLTAHCFLLAAVAAATAAAGDAVAAAAAAAAPPQSQPSSFLAVPLTWETADFQYYVNADVGAPPSQQQQQDAAPSFRLLVDTGSSNVWVPSSACAGPGCAGRARLDPSLPNAFHPSGGPEVRITYGDGQIVGSAGAATVTLRGTRGGGGGDSNGTPATVSFSQPLVLATSVNIGGGGDGSSSSGSGKGTAPWDGLLGMGREALSVRWMRPPLLSIADQHNGSGSGAGVGARMFGLYLAHDASAAGQGGELALGGWNAALTQGPVHWLPLAPPRPGVQQGYWSVAIDAIRLDGPDSGRAQTVLCATNSTGAADGSGSATPCVGAFDSGTSLLTGTIAQVGALNRALGFEPAADSGAGPPPGGCAAESARLAERIAAAGAGRPTSGAALSEACHALGNGPLSAPAILCGQVLANIEAARRAPGGESGNGGGAPSAEAIARAVAASAVDCEVLPYVINASQPCDALPSLPTLSFVLGGRAYSLPPSLYAARGPGGRCYSLVTALGNLPPNFWLLGDALMHRYYTIFDYGGGGGGEGGQAAAPPRVGIAELAPAEAARAARLDAALAAPIASSCRGRAATAWLPLLFALLLWLFCNPP